ncbi:MAG TPA: hypothetical protein EYQ31_04500 [Candidatus Handelsmanbacteria bacterium]|nr:hypothetical protein [Candidatus Handelsmanbacteria bacterium]
MADHVLRLFLDRFASKTRLEAPLPAALRYIYVAEGMATLRAGGGVSTLTADSGWFHDTTSHVGAAGDGAVLLRWELTCDPEPDDGVATGSGVDSQRLLDARLELDDADGYLLRGDKVELPPGGIAYRHTHAGAGIRCLVQGRFFVSTEGTEHSYKQYEPWFEAGPDPVLAWAPESEPGHFARVMILPRRLHGASSIRYMDEADRDRPKPQKYTVFADEPIELPRSCG